MDTSWLSKYIHAGCLIIGPLRLEIQHSLESLPNLPDFKFLTRRSLDFPISESLPPAVQQALIQSASLSSFSGLWQNGWIQMSSGYSRCDDTWRVRVYILPQDVDRGVDRGSSSLRTELTGVTSNLLSLLESSPACWNGEVDYEACNLRTRAGNETPLLSMFNNVPSPDPRPEKENNLDIRDGIQCLLESQIQGLNTKLYPYQGRSAAFMFQREENPGRIIDPRFISAVDHEGKPWYYDTVSGLVIKEPRYYDGVCGGILAEEMGTGKTLICLALILCTKGEPTKAPEPFVAEIPPRSGIASLVDMAAAVANKGSIPWKPWFDFKAAQHGYEYRNCLRALSRPQNRALYKVENILVETRRSDRNAPLTPLSREVYLSYVTLIIVPNNLVKQWQNEIKKHTSGLNVLVLVEKQEIPPVTVLLDYDLILFSVSRFEWIQKERSNGEGSALNIYCPLEHIRFKRCIIDEGHKLGNRSQAWKSDIMRVLDRLEIAARWVVTGTPSQGLYGVQDKSSETNDNSNSTSPTVRSTSTMKQEREDLRRIGNMASKYLKVRPWANTKEEFGDTVANWNIYVMDKEQHSNGHNRRDCLESTLNSLIIRHRLSDVSSLLPPVDEKIVLLDGSFQDRLSLNLFSMMIIFNSVQSQRTDQDYFFHERQRKSLIQLVKNLRQACFFGGVFYSVEDIAKSLDTAKEFLDKKEFPISDEDRVLLKQAISFGNLAVKNRLKNISNKFHSMPLYVENFPGDSGRNWSLDEQEADDQPICTDAGMILALQKFLNPCIDAPTSLQLMIETGRLDQQGAAERAQALTAATEASGGATTQTANAVSLAGNTPLGNDRHSKPKSGILDKAILPSDEGTQSINPFPEGHVKIAEQLAKTRIISTVSAKLSYLIDSIIKYQDNEQIIIFYDNDNIAYYLAGVLEILQIQHLIYARAGLSADRRAQYVATFTHNSNFRVLLMDISQAAFGLDMRSASRIYFISPVLNPQVEAQAIGRARRISQQKPVSVETLVLRNSIEEVIVNRRKQMTPAEHNKVKSVLEDRLMYQWIKNAKINPMSDEEDGVPQTAMLETPQFVFGRGFGRELHPDEGLVKGSPEGKNNNTTNGALAVARTLFKAPRGVKRPSSTTVDPWSESDDGKAHGPLPKRRGHVAFAD